MRTTITLDDDLAIRLERRRAEHGTTFKDVVNDTLRAGLAALEAPPTGPTGEVAVTRPLPLGRRLIADVDDVADALAIAEGEDFG
jgi:plasmid stability protein